MKCKPLLILLIATIFIGGCKEDGDKEPRITESASTSQQEQTNIESKIEPLPTTYAQLAEREPGEIHHNYVLLTNEEIQKLLEDFSDLPDIREKPSEQELDYFYQELLAKVQEDYKGPEYIINELKFQAIGSPEFEGTRYEFKENLNVMILLDASGSMKEEVAGKVKMQAAKESIQQFVESLPESAQVGIRIYGHKGTGSDGDKALSCSSSDIVYPISTYQESNFTGALNSITPSGWTPTGFALNEVVKDLASYNGDHNTNIVYLVSDGISTCDDSPVEAAKLLYDSNISPIINVIGLDVNNEGQEQLRDIAKATDGMYTYVTDGSELSKEFSKLNDLTDQWEKWKKQGVQSLNYKKIHNNMDIFVYIVNEKVKSTNERRRIDSVVHYFWKEGLIGNDAQDYLKEKNSHYHDWINGEIEKFDHELSSLNDKGYGEAVQHLEEIYNSNNQ